jgi:outer membrane protein insertion porin family
MGSSHHVRDPRATDASARVVVVTRRAERRYRLQRHRPRGLLATTVLLAGLPVSLSAAAPAETREEVIERIEVAGNRYMRADTLTYYISSRAGDRYDELQLKEDFRRLWDTGFLDDMSLEVHDGQAGKVVVFTVQERKRIQIVDYRGSKAAATSEIEDRLKERDAELRIDSFYDQSRARRAEVVIKDLLMEKGRPFAIVTHQEKTLGGAGTQVSFLIDDGPKAKIREIAFEGNQIFSDGTLRGRMRRLKQGGLFNLSWIGGKRTYTEEKWSEDRESIRELYLNNGYVTASVGDPELVYDDPPSETSQRKPTRYLTLRIPITEGQQYRVGSVAIEGSTVFKEAFLRSMFKLQPGDVYSEKRIEKGYEKLREIYGAAGYIQWTALTRRSPDPERRVVDLVLSMEEDKRYFVGKIIFTGNDSTRDKVIRREVYLTEGEVFSTELLKASIKRIDQLGYFKPIEGVPDIRPAEGSEDHLDVTFEVAEQNRNQFSFGGGFSALEGVYLSGSFQTTNFFGSGETVALVGETGYRTRTFQLAVTEPYFLDRAMTVGLDVSFRRVKYLSYGSFVGFGQQTQSASVTGGLRVGRFSQVLTSYSYRIVDIYDVDEDALGSTETSTVPAEGSLIPSADLTYFGEVGRRHESGVNPSWVRNTVDNPYQPRSGSRCTAGLQLVGGFLGGSVDFLRPDLELVIYQPLGRRIAVGARGQGGYIRPFGATAELPHYQRYYLGGEYQIRGFPPRTIAPLDTATGALKGGNKFLLFNAEGYLDLVASLRLVLFFDAGQAYPEGQGLYWKTMSTSAGAELRFLMPVLNVPFRLIYAWNPNRDYWQPARAMKFAVGTTF